MNGNILLALAGALLCLWVYAVQPTSPMNMSSAELASSANRGVATAQYEGGKFVVEVEVNGVSLPFVVDSSGAMAFACLSSDAAELFGDAVVVDGKARMRSVFGDVQSARTGHIKKIRIGSIVMRDVPVAIIPIGESNLLGAPFLASLKRFAYVGGNLVLEQ